MTTEHEQIRDKPADTALIFGCGYLGQRLAARLLAIGTTVYGTTRSPQQGETLAGAGIRPLLVEITSVLTLAALRVRAKRLD